MPQKPGKIFVVATPIGNLEDITYRAVRTIREANLLLAEDTRVGRKLLAHFHIEKPLVRLDEHASDKRLKETIKKLQSGTNIALITDAGTPNVSDPGWRIIRSASLQGIEIVPVPGPSALTALISISHFPMSEFVFTGFPPAKKGRAKFFDAIRQEPRPVVIYESTHRILKTIQELSLRLPEREAIIAKELTKLYERIWRGKLGTIVDQLDSLTKQELKGEWVIAISK